MLLVLSASALALTVPLRATFTEETSPGEPAAASSALTATVAIANPLTGTAFGVSASELTVNGREATGGTPLSFASPPAGTLRTWAVYFVDADGEVLGDPEVVDVLFDAKGNGAIAARDGGARLSAIAVSTSGATGRLRVSVADAGTEAAYVGVVELASDGGRLFTDPEMSALDAAAYATFQALGLDAMVALDSWKVHLEGSLSVSGLTVADDGTVEGGADLCWDLAFHDGRTVLECSKAGGCTPTPVTTGTASYESPIGAVKRKKATETPRVSLKPADIAYDTWDAGLSFTIAGDVRDLELAAALDARAGDTLLRGSDVISLDPSGLGVTAREDDDDDDDTGMIVDIFIDTDCEDCGDYDFSVPNPANPPAWVAIAQQQIDVTVLDSDGRAVSTHACTLRPTAGTQAGTVDRAVLVGDCTRDEAGTEVRRLRAVVGPHGTSFWSVDLAGSAFTRESTVTTCEKGGACGTATTSVAGGSVELAVDGKPFLARPIAVTSTTWDLPFTFDADVEGLRAALTVDLVDPTRTLAWSVSDGVAYGKAGDETVYAIVLEDVELAATGLYATPRDVVLSSKVAGDTLRLTGESRAPLKR